MDPRTLAIPLAFILLSTVLCLLLIGSKWKWWQKLILIVTVPAFGIAVWGSIASFKGWPTTAEPPDKGLLFWALVREPNPKISDPGAIYLWILPLDGSNKSRAKPLDYVPPAGEPRAYKLPYSRGVHKMSEKSRNLLLQGKPVLFQRKNRTGNGDGEGEGEGGESGQNGGNGRGRSNGRGNGYGSTDDESDDYMMYELPDVEPAPKQNQK